jgi:MFS superfamily sulfate permease-like transporter
VVGCALFALLGGIGLPALAPLPQAVLAGIMLTLALALVDRWSRDQLELWWAGLRDAELLWNLAVVALVCVITVTFGFAAGVLLGVLCSMLLFIRSMNRSLVRARFTAAERPSRRMHAFDDERLLQTLRRRVTLLELEGALFFGSAEKLLSEIESLPSDCAGLVLDLRRVTAIDASGSVVLAQCARRLARHGVPLLLAGVSAQDRIGRSLLALSGRGRIEARDWHPDADHAVEALELRLLAAIERPARADSVPLADSDLCRGLDDAARAALQRRLARRRLAAGEVLFRLGDPADRMYVLCSGSVTLRGAPPADGGPRPRFAVLSPGTMFGETALLDGGGRSGEAVADTPSELVELSGADLAALRAEAPEVAAAVMTNIARHLSGRLRTASRG